MLTTNASPRLDFRHQLGANLRRLRKRAGLTQEGLMVLADVHRTQISMYERGGTEPQAESLARLSRALGIGAEEFFAGVGWAQAPRRLVIEPLTATSPVGSRVVPRPGWGSIGLV